MRIHQQGFSPRFLAVKKYLNDLQKRIRAGLEEVGGDPFRIISWKHSDRGGGKSLLIEPTEPIEFKPSINKTGVFERAGVNVSAVGGILPSTMAELLKTKSKSFSACGISLVIHPRSPLIPTIHMNVRFFEMGKKEFWFGGGIDLTPYYPSLEDFRHFHITVAEAVKNIYPERYLEFKKKCDDYFFLPHRKEMRGVGGIFFDYLKGNYDKDFSLIRSVGDSFLKCYLPIVRNNLRKKYGVKEKQFQLFRRGRYVEFNLLYDRGTLFGLKTGGRVDSILMSLPPEVSFTSQPKYSRGRFELEMQSYYQPRQWVK